MILNSRLEFARAVVLDFYDGAVNGFTEIVDVAGNRGWFRFELVARDERQNARVFCLADAPAVATILADAAGAKWPFWAINIPAQVVEKLEQLRNASTHFVALVLSDGYFRTVSAVKLVTADIEAKIPAELPQLESDHFVDWATLTSTDARV